MNGPSCKSIIRKIDNHLQWDFKLGMARRQPSLDALRVLAACVRHGKFSRAALELGVSPNAVSQRVRALEVEIGVKLFRRHGPTLVTTGRARALGQRVEQALSLMRTAVDDCRRVRQPLRVTCAPTFASRWWSRDWQPITRFPALMRSFWITPRQFRRPVVSTSPFEVGLALGWDSTLRCSWLRHARRCLSRRGLSSV